jgi:hypothetical protein
MNKISIFGAIPLPFRGLYVVICTFARGTSRAYVNMIYDELKVNLSNLSFLGLGFFSSFILFTWWSPLLFLVFFFFF